MDFKVAGTENGITALQMDIKIEGITKEIMQVALHRRARAGCTLLGIMKEALEGSRAEISSYAPRIIKIQDQSERRSATSSARACGHTRAAGGDRDHDRDLRRRDRLDRLRLREGGQAAKKRIEDITSGRRGGPGCTTGPC